MIDKLFKFDLKAKFIRCTKELKINAKEVGITIDIIMKEAPNFTKFIQKYFFSLNQKAKMEEEYFPSIMSYIIRKLQTLLKC